MNCPYCNARMACIGGGYKLEWWFCTNPVRVTFTQTQRCGATVTK